MKRFSALAAVAAATITFSSCYTNPVTGRRGLSLVDESTMETMAAQQYTSFLSQNRPIAAGNRDAEMVKRVGSRIAAGVQSYLNSRNEGDQIAGFQWEFNLVNSNEANAWCMPGGKVVVYSGILPLTQNEAGLAVVMGHEIGHAVAHHAAERASQQMAAQVGTQALGALAGSNPSAAAQVFNAAVGIGAQGALLKFSRTQESEADHIGLIFDALAGYNPQEAIPFWQRMAAQSNGQNPPEILSTHPSDARRIQDIQNELPEAMKYYRPAGGTQPQPQPQQRRR